MESEVRAIAQLPLLFFMLDSLLDAEYDEGHHQHKRHPSSHEIRDAQHRVLIAKDIGAAKLDPLLAEGYRKVYNRPSDLLLLMTIV